MTEALETKHYVSATGKYLGGYGGVRKHVTDPATGDTTTVEEWPVLPAGAVEVPSPPTSPLDRWNGTAWAPPTADVVAAAKTKLATDLINGTPAIVALVEALAGRLSITPATLLADVVAKIAVK